MILNSDFIPHENFHKGFWLKTEKCPWFFFYESPRDFKLNKIRKDGIELINPETDRRFFYKNQNYKLPYTKDDFLKKLRKYQTKGVLGMVDEGNIYEKLKGKVPVKKNDGVTLILTEGKTPKEITRKWKEIEKILKDV